MNREVVNILQKVLNERKEKGLTEEVHDQVYNAMLEREIIIHKHLNFSHLNAIGKTIEEFEEYMKDKEIYVMSNNAYLQLISSNATLELIKGVIEKQKKED